MSVLVDTSVWSLALRRAATREQAEVTELAAVIQEGRVAMIGAIRQEILSGVRNTNQYRMLRDRLRAFADTPLGPEDYEEGAICFNRCRAKGLQGSNTDFLICAVSVRRGFTILTTDHDFLGFSRVLGFELHEVRSTRPDSARRR